jgi:hypothetical protein
VRACPRCGVQVEVYKDACDCGFSWVPQMSATPGDDFLVPGEFRPVATVDQPRRVVIWPWIVGILLFALGGWHIYCSEQLEASIGEYIKSHIGDSPADATLKIHVQPITNVVSLELWVVDKDAASLEPSVRLMLDAALSYIRSEVEPYLERELSLIARKQVDLYAMALPYRIAFSLKISPK